MLERNPLMSNLCIVSDCHFKGKDFFHKMGMLSEMMKMCSYYGVTHILNAGDTFDCGEVGDKIMPTEKIVKGFTDILSLYPEITWIMVEGNHDQYCSGGRSGSALDYIHLPNVWKIQDEISEYHHANFSLMSIPWVVNEKNYYSKTMEYLNTTDMKYHNCRIILGHLNIIDCNLGKHGYCSAEHYYSFGLPDLEASVFNPTRIFLGHVHTKIDLSPKSMYMGAFSQLRFDEDEGKAAGFHIYDTLTDKLTFYDLSYMAPQYFTIKENELSAYNLEKDFVRFYTDNPEKYKHLRGHVKAMMSKQEKVVSQDILKQINSEELNVANLIKSYCAVSGVAEPTTEYYKDERDKLALKFSNTQTGLDFIHDITLKGVGIHDNKTVEFKSGFNCIVGPNGSGKSTLIESLYAGLYENFPERGNIKTLMDKGSSLEINIEAKGTKYEIRKELTNKRFLSYINGTQYELVGQYKNAIEPIFGDAATFSKLVFMDQTNKFDLVKTPESTRLEAFRELFDLKYFDEKADIYKKELKAVKESISKYTEIESEIASLTHEYNDIQLIDVPYYAPEALEALVKIRDANVNNNRIYDKNIVSIKEAEEIREFEYIHNIPQMYEDWQEIKELKRKVNTSKDWCSVGCREKPLPCIFLKGFDPTEQYQLAARLDDLLSKFPTKDWDRYTAIKKNHTPPDPTLKWLDPEPNLNALQAVLLAKSQNESNSKLVKARAGVKSRLEAKQALLNDMDLAQLEERSKDLKFLLSLCSKNGLSLFIIDLIKTELQNIINELIEFSELGVKITLSTAKEENLDSFQILFGEKERDICKASGGEIGLVRILFKLAVMVYLNRYFRSYKVLILDEPTAALDHDNTEAVVAIIKKLCLKDFSQVIVVSHSSKLANSCDNRIEI